MIWPAERVFLFQSENVASFKQFLLFDSTSRCRYNRCSEMSMGSLTSHSCRNLWRTDRPTNRPCPLMYRMSHKYPKSVSTSWMSYFKKYIKRHRFSKYSNKNKWSDDRRAGCVTCSVRPSNQPTNKRTDTWGKLHFLLNFQQDISVVALSVFIQD